MVIAVAATVTDDRGSDSSLLKLREGERGLKRTGAASLVDSQSRERDATNSGDRAANARKRSKKWIEIQLTMCEWKCAYNM